jgi:hypothetical protein
MPHNLERKQKTLFLKPAYFPTSLKMLLGVEGWNPLLGGNAPNPYLTINCGYLLSEWF